MDTPYFCSGHSPTSDQSFAASVGKVKEHYGFDVPVSSLRALTIKHAARINSAACTKDEANRLPGTGCKRLEAQADGSFVTVVSAQGHGGDRRKKRVITYREARLCACRAQGSTRTHYRATMGQVDELGLLWKQCAKAAGRGLNTFVHVVGDGAEWITRQAYSQLGCDRQLVDFFHLCEYLKAAQPACAQNSRWYATQKKRLLQNRSDKVLTMLEEHLEEPGVDDAQAPVRQAHRYLRNRPEQPDYAGKRADELPIGSGLIESGNKHVIQARMKIAGAAWLDTTAESMIETRAMRASARWNEFWHN